MKKFATIGLVGIILLTAIALIGQISIEKQKSATTEEYVNMTAVTLSRGVTLNKKSDVMMGKVLGLYVRDLTPHDGNIGLIIAEVEVQGKKHIVTAIIGLHQQIVEGDKVIIRDFIVTPPNNLLYDRFRVAEKAQ